MEEYDGVHRAMSGLSSPSREWADRFQEAFVSRSLVGECPTKGKLKEAERLRVVAAHLEEDKLREGSDSQGGGKGRGGRMALEKDASGIWIMMYR